MSQVNAGKAKVMEMKVWGSSARVWCMAMSRACGSYSMCVHNSEEVDGRCSVMKDSLQE